MCLSIALTAARLGASVVNHTEVLELLKEHNAAGKLVVTGAKVKDSLTGQRLVISLINSLCLTWLSLSVL